MCVEKGRVARDGSGLGRRDRYLKRVFEKAGKRERWGADLRHFVREGVRPVPRERTTEKVARRGVQHLS